MPKIQVFGEILTRERVIGDIEYGWIVIVRVVEGAP